MEHFLGIHISRLHSDFYYCLLNQDLEIRTLEKGHLDEVLSYAASDDTGITALDAPSSLNKGFMREERYRSQFDPPPTMNRWVNLRLGEYELVRKRMKITHTPANKGACPQWMKKGIDLHEDVKRIGYVPYPIKADKVCMEVPGEAAFQSLLGRRLLPVKTTEGRIQRQLLLWRMGLQVADPMLAFEEITRYRLERGQFPFREILSAGELLSMVCAFVAWLSKNRPNQVQSSGMEEEGLIVLPVQLIHN